MEVLILTLLEYQIDLRIFFQQQPLWQRLDPYSSGILDRLILYAFLSLLLRLDPYSTGILDRLFQRLKNCLRQSVLILTLLEYQIDINLIFIMLATIFVLILTLLEYLIDENKYSEQQVNTCLDPYSTGILDRHLLFIIN